MIKSNSLEVIQKNKQTYSASYEAMTWLTPEKARAASQRRDDLIKAIFEHPGEGPGWQFAGTKLYTHKISPGCDLCGRGGWSCLFINGVCNARCFYCPSTQKEKGQPMTSSVEFSNPQDYAAYVNAFNIQGVSFSGGEPFMTFDRVLTFLKTLRARVTHPLYIWMYTNGILVTEDKLKQLRDSGLDEIRFDLSANHYTLDALKKALGIIPCVTVEIPAIPEDLEKTRNMVKELHGLGVDHLNLHQLRCTPHNTDAFIKKGYTFLHGPGVTVLETELTALELIRYTQTENIALPINYCSFTYRNQFQGSGAKKRTALKIKSAHEDITPTGHIRTMSLFGGEDRIRSIHDHLLSTQLDTALWKVSKSFDQLFFNAALWPEIEFNDIQLKVSYSSSALKSAVSYRHAFKEILLGRKKKVVVERYLRVPGLVFKGEEIPLFGKAVGLGEAERSTNTAGSLSDDRMGEIRAYEALDPGLAPYY